MKYLNSICRNDVSQLYDPYKAMIPSAYHYINGMQYTLPYYYIFIVFHCLSAQVNQRTNSQIVTEYILYSVVKVNEAKTKLEVRQDSVQLLFSVSSSSSRPETRALSSMEGRPFYPSEMEAEEEEMPGYYTANSHQYQDTEL